MGFKMSNVISLCKARDSKDSECKSEENQEYFAQVMKNKEKVKRKKEALLNQDVKKIINNSSYTGW